ncbi:MAG: hypothetical protein ACR2I5_10320 [Candidatus Limnocylindria bacterium]|jgi:hypothetical protein
MGQVNVNTPNDRGTGTGEPAGSSGAGFIIGIIVAIIVIALLVYFLVLDGGATDPGSDPGTDPGNGATESDDGGLVDPTEPGEPAESVPASGWVLTYHA